MHVRTEHMHSHEHMHRRAPRHPPCTETCRALQERVGRGDYNAATTRVLHFKFNPEAEMQREARDARVAELESENEALKEHLQRLEAAAAAQQVRCACAHHALCSCSAG